MVYYDTNTIIPYMYQISRIRTCIIARPESVPHHSAIICAVPLLLFPVHLSIGLPWPLRVGSYYSYTPHYTLFIIRYIYILSAYATLYLYHYIIYTSILVIFTYSYISILYYPFISIYTTLSTFAEILLLCIIRGRLSITYFI